MTDLIQQTKQERVAAQRALSRAKGTSKKDRLIRLLSRSSGVDGAFISSLFGWQPHTTRAALSGLRKAGFDITKESAGAGKPTRYQIVSAPNAAAKAVVTNGK